MGLGSWDDEDTCSGESSEKELNLLDPSSSDKEGALPPEPLKPPGTRFCTTCGKSCQSTGAE